MNILNQLYDSDKHFRKHYQHNTESSNFNFQFKNTAFSQISSIKLNKQQLQLDWKYRDNQYKYLIAGNSQILSLLLQKQQTKELHYFGGLNFDRRGYTFVGGSQYCINSEQYGTHQLKPFVELQEQSMDATLGLEYKFKYNMDKMYQLKIISMFQHQIKNNSSIFNIIGQDIKNNIIMGLNNEYLYLSYKYPKNQFEQYLSLIYDINTQQKNIIYLVGCRVSKQVELVGSISNRMELMNKVVFHMDWFNFGYCLKIKNKENNNIGFHVNIN